MSHWSPPPYDPFRTGYSYTPFYAVPPETPEQREAKALRKEANFVGVMMLALTAGTQTAAIVVAFALTLLGVIDLRQITQDMFGMSNSQYLLVYALIYILAFAVPTICVALCFKRRQFPLAPAEPVSGRTAFWGVLAAMGVCVVANLIASAVVSFFEQFGVPAPEIPDLLVPTPTSLALNIIVIAVLPALLEEMVFRGYVLRTLRPYGDGFAVVVSSLLFALMHGNIEQIPFAFCVGLALGWLCVSTNNIWLAVAVHFCNNGMSVLLDYCGRSLPDDKVNLLYWIVMITLGALGLLAFLVLGIKEPAVFSRRPSQTVLATGVRIKLLLRSPAFIISVLLFLVLTVWGAMQ